MCAVTMISRMLESLCVLVADTWGCKNSSNRCGNKMSAYIPIYNFPSELPNSSYKKFGTTPTTSLIAGNFNFFNF